VCVGPDSSVGMATLYWLDGPGSNLGGCEIFHTRPERPWDPPRSFSGVKRPGRGVGNTLHLVPRLKKE